METTSARKLKFFVKNKGAEEFLKNNTMQKFRHRFATQGSTCDLEKAVNAASMGNFFCVKKVAKRD